MRAISKFAGLSLTVVLLVGVTLTLVFQQQSLRRVRRDNQLLRQQVEGLAARADQLATDKHRLSQLLATQQPAAGASLTPEQRSELLKLRGEVGRLRLQDREVEQSRRDQMQTARVKLPQAEAEFARAASLHSNNLVSAYEFNQTRFALELLRAEAKGNTTEAAEIRLRQAEGDFEHMAVLYREKLVSEAEYNKARHAVDLRRAELQGDRTGATQARLRQAEEDLARAAGLRNQSLISEPEYNEAVRKVEALRANTAR